MKIDFLKKNLLKKNQVVIYAIALLLVTAGYLNFSSLNSNNTQETANLETEDINKIKEEADYNESLENTESIENNENNENKNNSKVADIGDAALVSSNDVVQTNTVNNNIEDYFTKSKLERDTMYSQMLEAYQKILNSSNSSETQRQSATTEIAKINNIKNGIMVCENLIGTKGFSKNILFVNGDSVNVIIGTNQLKPEQIAQIQNIVSREMKAQIENIHIAMK
ncbi:MAG: SpoIIIAH-like family protein [Clostridia bacterium]|nr:SpoIIIAH-like family protein [Clostridia bacterium]